MRSTPFRERLAKVNRASIILALVAVVCCAGVPLLLGAGGLSFLAARQGGVLAGLLALIILIGAIAIYAHAKRRMSSNTLRIELLAFAGCPNAASARANIAQALAKEGRTADVTYVEVDTPDLARQMHFLGSPSVRVNGLDVEPAARSRNDFGLMCRTYSDGPTVSGAPSVELIRDALTS